MVTIDKKTWVLNKKCRFVDWTHPNEGFDAFKEVVDLFISTAIDDIVNEYRGEKVEWLEFIQGGPVIFPGNQDYRSLEVMPTQHGPFSDQPEDTRLCYRLYTKLWDDEIRDAREAGELDYETIGLRFWGIIEECLTSERAHISLAEAKTLHPMRLAGYAYEPDEGMHYLPKLADPEFKRRYDECLRESPWLKREGE